ncbi:putative transporter MCH4 [Talaromyces islandicus]|uniref:Putative transporter MCH4 n=1 Tax=Talaromyces islandicus TaxID=28573 RepID=A0A0U1LV81_TALIS|nr:putative transporter MCH4 [Talaromyces islandicus]
MAYPASQEGSSEQPDSKMIATSLGPDHQKEEWTIRHTRAIIGSFCGLFASFGWYSSTGLFQDYYQRNQLRDYSPSTISWISSMGFFLVYSGTCFFGPLSARFGATPVVVVGSMLQVGGLLGTAFSSKLYQFLVLQGFLSALGASAVFFATIQIFGQWFRRRQALLVGISASGTSVGGVVFPLMIQSLLPKVDFRWTMIYVVFVILFLLLVAIFCVRAPSTAPPAPQPPDNNGQSWLTVFKDYNLLLAIAGIAFLSGTFTLVVTFVVAVARLRGWNDQVNAIVCLNAASFLGRIIPGVIAEYIGRLNTMAIFSFLSTVLILGLWLPSSGVPASIAFSVTWGFASASVVSLGPAILFQLSRPQDGVRNLALLYCVQSIAALTASPTGGALLSIEDDGNPRYLQLLAGLLSAVGTILIVLVRWLRSGAVLWEAL